MWLKTTWKITWLWKICWLLNIANSWWNNSMISWLYIQQTWTFYCSSYLTLCRDTSVSHWAAVMQLRRAVRTGSLSGRTLHIFHSLTDPLILMNYMILYHSKWVRVWFSKRERESRWLDLMCVDDRRGGKYYLSPRYSGRSRVTSLPGCKI